MGSMTLVGCPRCGGGFQHSWLYLQGQSLLFCGVCPRCAPLHGERLVGIEFDGLGPEEVAEAVMADVPCISGDGTREFHNVSDARKLGLGPNDLLDFMFGGEGGEE